MFMLATALTVSVAANAQTPKTETPAIKALHIGDKAPAVDIAHWVKGDKVASFEEGKIYVVEFWATWCGPCRAAMPHISESQAKYKDYGVKFVSISDEPLETVTKFLKDTDKKSGKTWNDIVQYTLTTDPDRSNHEAYMWGVGAGGIPTAFIVGKDTKLEWVGHPMDMDKVLDSVVKDSWDRAVFAKEFEPQAEKDRAELAKGLGERLKMKEFKLLLSEKNDPNKGYAIGEEIMKANWEKPAKLNELAWYVVDDAAVKTRNLDFAHKAAEQAVKLTEEKDGAIMDTLARVYFEKGDFAKAVEWQKKAVATAPEQMAAELKAALEKYEAAAKGK